MPEPLNRADLDAAVCQTPGCNHQGHGPLHLHGRCHPSAGCSVSYTRGSGVLDVRCRRCNRTVCQVAVAAGQEPES